MLYKWTTLAKWSSLYVCSFLDAIYVTFHSHYKFTTTKSSGKHTSKANQNEKVSHYKLSIQYHRIFPFASWLLPAPWVREHLAFNHLGYGILPSSKLQLTRHWIPLWIPTCWGKELTSFHQIIILHFSVTRVPPL